MCENKVKNQDQLIFFEKRKRARNPHIDYDAKTKICSNCNINKDWSLFPSYMKKKPNGERKKTLSNLCTECRNERDRIRARLKSQTDDGRLKMKQSVLKYRKSQKYEAAKELRRLKALIAQDHFCSLSVGAACSVNYAKCYNCDNIYVENKWGVCRRCRSLLSGRYHYWKTVLEKGEKECKQCGGLFYSLEMGATQDYCSEHCLFTSKKKAKKIYRQRRRSKFGHSGSIRSRCKQYGVYYEPVSRSKLFKRDKWRCCICKIKVQIGNPNEDNAAEWDHILPISKGGPHTYTNLQTLCRKCNAEKKDKVINGIQLSVFYMVSTS